MWIQNRGWRSSLFRKLFLKRETATYFILKLHLPLLESERFVIGNLTWTIAQPSESSSYESLVLFHRPLWMFLGCLVQFVCSLAPCASYLWMSFLKIRLYSHFFLISEILFIASFLCKPLHFAFKVLHPIHFYFALSSVTIFCKLNCPKSDPLRASILFLENISPYFSGCINVSSLPLTSPL